MRTNNTTPTPKFSPYFSMAMSSALLFSRDRVSSIESEPAAESPEDTRAAAEPTRANPRPRPWFRRILARA